MKIFTKILFIILLLIASHYADAMSWKLSNFQNESYIVSFFPDENSKEVLLMIKCDQSSLEELPQEHQKLFKKNNEMFVYSNFESYEDTISPDSIETVQTVNRLVCNGKPKEISIEKLVEIIKSKNVIFYTGAGISAGSVPTMDELMRDLGISDKLQSGHNLQTYITDVIQRQKSYINVLRNFFDKCANAAPSRAHTIISKIISGGNQLLVTENLDQLHQKTGLAPVVLASCDVYSNDEKIKTALSSADFVITVGLNSDESGFLKFYKQMNPKGKIISLNLKYTDYLSDDDMLVIGDIQDVFEKLGLLLGF